jgi:hypothetical protein
MPPPTKRGRQIQTLANVRRNKQNNFKTKKKIFSRGKLSEIRVTINNNQGIIWLGKQPIVALESSCNDDSDVGSDDDDTGDYVAFENPIVENDENQIVEYDAL